MMITMTLTMTPHSDQVIFFTSGTEGLPKLIVHDGYYPIGLKQ